MSKITNSGLDHYGAETLEQQYFGTAGVEGVKKYYRFRMNIPTISIINPMQAASEMIIVRAVAETQKYDK